MKPLNNYDPIASFYDAHWTDRYHPSASVALKAVIVERVPPRSSLLDLCCGTGEISRRLAMEGYRVAGIDISPHMIECARNNVPEAIFEVGDARSFRLVQPVHAVVSLFDSLNHLLTAEELLSAFRCVHRAILPRGVFVFDMNMEEAYRTQWGKWSAHVHPDEVCIVRGGYDDHLRIGRTEITFFRRQRRWNRYEVELKQRVLSGAGDQGASCHGRI